MEMQSQLLLNSGIYMYQNMEWSQPLEWSGFLEQRFGVTSADFDQENLPSCFILFTERKPIFTGSQASNDTLQEQGWQKGGKYSYFPGRREILVIPGNYW